MSSTLTYGHVRPDTGDLGSTFWDQLRNNITQDDGHTHNGSNSSLLTSTAITPVQDTTSLVAASWVATAGGTYRILVTTPPSVSFSNYGLAFEITNGSDIGARFTPTVVKVSATSFYTYVNDNTINATIIYLV